jgi:tetratricopeptide (TPR) repeat protein
MSRFVSRALPHRIRFCTLRHPMWRVIAILLVAVAFLGGCDELSARQHVQKGNYQYGEQDYKKAVEHYEKAMKLAPDLDVVYHNAGIAYSRLFSEGLETPENKAIAAKATENLAKWLEKHPTDVKIRKLLTGLWINSGDYQKALDYWQKEHDANPKARDIIQLIAGIHLKSGDWRTAIVWYRKDGDAATDVPGKVSAYQSIANLAFSKLFSMSAREKVFGLERTEIAEIGLEAAEAALELDPQNLALTSISAGLWGNRATAQGPFWAQTLDRAEGQVYEQRARVLREEAKKNQPAPAGGAGGGATPPAGAPGNGAKPSGS